MNRKRATFKRKTHDPRLQRTSMPYRPAMPALRTADAMTLHAVWMAFMRRVRSPVASGCLCSWSRMYRVRVMGSWPAGRSGVMSMVDE